jgi:putative hydrolase of the HAD superfamily
VHFDAVLFDFGETLLGRGDGVAALMDAARQQGAEVTEEAARRLWDEIQERGRTPEEMAKGRDLSPEAHRACWTALYEGADVLADGVGAALYEREISPQGWVPAPDAEPTLRALAGAGIKIGVVSDTGWDIRPVFVHHGLDRFVDAFVLSCEHGDVKPAPGLFLAACAALGVAPEHTLMVGDNPLSDGGAVDAGMSTLLLPVAEPGRRRGLDAVLRLVGLGSSA